MPKKSGFNDQDRKTSSGRTYWILRPFGPQMKILPSILMGPPWYEKTEFRDSAGRLIGRQRSRLREAQSMDGALLATSPLSGKHNTATMQIEPLKHKLTSKKQKG